MMQHFNKNTILISNVVHKIRHTNCRCHALRGNIEKCRKQFWSAHATLKTVISTLLLKSYLALPNRRDEVFTRVSNVLIFL